MDGDAVAVLYMVADPTGDVLRRRVDIQYFVDILMVEGVLDDPFDVGEVGDHPVAIQFFGTAIDGDDPVVAVQGFTFAFVRQI